MFVSQRICETHSLVAKQLEGGQFVLLQIHESVVHTSMNAKYNKTYLHTKISLTLELIATDVILINKLNLSRIRYMDVIYEKIT